MFSGVPRSLLQGLSGISLNLNAWKYLGKSSCPVRYWRVEGGQELLVSVEAPKHSPIPYSFSGVFIWCNLFWKEFAELQSLGYY